MNARTRARIIVVGVGAFWSSIAYLNAQIEWVSRSDLWMAGLLLVIVGAYVMERP